MKNLPTCLKLFAIGLLLGLTWYIQATEKEKNVSPEIPPESKTVLVQSETDYIPLIEKLAGGTHTKRAQAIKKELKSRGKKFKIVKRSAENIIVEATEKEKGIILVIAHYDIVPQSLGLNDNTSSIALILTHIQEFPPNVEVVFTDYEELGCVGMYEYLSYAKKTKRKILACINLDVIGCGDAAFMDLFGQSIPKKITKGAVVNRIPPNDGRICNRWGYKTITFAAIRTDLSYNEALKNLMTTMHNGSRDNKVSELNNKGMRAVKEKLFMLFDFYNKVKTEQTTDAE